MNTKPKLWHSIEVATTQEAVEPIEFALNSLDALGTATSFNRIGNQREVIVTGYFDLLPADDRVRNELDYALESYQLDREAIQSVKTSVLENQDWLAEWKKYWRPTTIGRFVVSPPWAPSVDPGKIDVRIEPNMAFGTGTHETTQLCIAAIDRHYRPGGSFLDVGTGTGILAIAAAKLGHGAERICAIDNDEDSVKIARENAKANGVGNVDVRVASLDAGVETFDLVCANLTLEVILPNIDLLEKSAERILVLSGILGNQESEIIAALDGRSRHSLGVERLGEWIAVILEKEPG